MQTQVTPSLLDEQTKAVTVLDVRVDNGDGQEPQGIQRPRQITLTSFHHDETFIKVTKKPQMNEWFDLQPDHKRPRDTANDIPNTKMMP